MYTSRGSAQGSVSLDPDSDFGRIRIQWTWIRNTPKTLSDLAALGWRIVEWGELFEDLGWLPVAQEPLQQVEEMSAGEDTIRYQVVAKTLITLVKL